MSKRMSRNAFLAVGLAAALAAPLCVHADEQPRMGAEAKAAAMTAGAARHEAFRREHHVRSPHPQWFNSLRPGADGVPALVLADDYIAQYAILLPAKPSAQETQAATELALRIRIARSMAPPHRSSG